MDAYPASINGMGNSAKAVRFSFATVSAVLLSAGEDICFFI